MRADLAGIDPSQVSLEVRAAVSSCSRASASPSRRPTTASTSRWRSSRGAFRRVVALGAEVDADAADAAYEDGILTVELPLSRPDRPRTVPIRGTNR